MFHGAVPPQPIKSIELDRLGILTSIGNLRFLFLVPWLVGISLGLYWMAEDIYREWKSTEVGHIEYVEYRKNKYGDDYFQNTDNAVARRKYERLVEGRKMTLNSYLYYRYNEVAYADRNFIVDLVFGGMAIAIIFILIVAILSFHRRASLYFDRKRKIVYTWRFGRAWAQCYDDLWYYSNNVAMSFILYSFDKKGRFKMKRFVVTPSGNPFLNGEVLYRPVLAFIIQFMERGRDAVWASDWEGRRGWYLFEDRRPEDLQVQIDEVLAHIEEAGVNNRVDVCVAEWGLGK